MRDTQTWILEEKNIHILIMLGVRLRFGFQVVHSTQNTIMTKDTADQNSRFENVALSTKQNQCMKVGSKLQGRRKV